MTAPNALMGGWIAVWRPASSKKFAATTVDASVSFKCGSTDLTANVASKF
jgi:hypothetical protein